MTRPVPWSRDAVNDLKKQLVDIAAEDPILASRVVDRLRQVATELEDFAAGRPGSVTGNYEKSVTGLPYIIAYEIVSRDTGDIVAVLRVIHTARDWPEEIWPSD